MNNDSFYTELKDLCRRHDLSAAVYTKSKDEEHTHHIYTVTDTEKWSDQDTHILISAILYLMDLLIGMADNRLYALHVILDLISMVLKQYKEDPDEEAE